MDIRRLSHEAGSKEQGKQQKVAMQISAREEIQRNLRLEGEKYSAMLQQELLQQEQSMVKHAMTPVKLQEQLMVKHTAQSRILDPNLERMITTVVTCALTTLLHT